MLQISLALAHQEPQELEAPLVLLEDELMLKEVAHQGWVGGTQIMESLVWRKVALLALEWKVGQAVRPRWVLLEPLAVVQLRLLAITVARCEE